MLECAHARTPINWNLHVSLEEVDGASWRRIPPRTCFRPLQRSAAGSGQPTSLGERSSGNTCDLPQRIGIRQVPYRKPSACPIDRVHLALLDRLLIRFYESWRHIGRLSRTLQGFRHWLAHGFPSRDTYQGNSHHLPGSRRHAVAAWRLTMTSYPHVQVMTTCTEPGQMRYPLW